MILIFWLVMALGLIPISTMKYLGCFEQLPSPNPSEVFLTVSLHLRDQEMCLSEPQIPSLPGVTQPESDRSGIQTTVVWV